MERLGRAIDAVVVGCAITLIEVSPFKV